MRALGAREAHTDYPSLRAVLEWEIKELHTANEILRLARRVAIVLQLATGRTYRHLDHGASMKNGAIHSNHDMTRVREDWHSTARGQQGNTRGQRRLPATG